MRLSGLHCEENLPDEWVVHCKKVGRGEQALAYLGRYLYRGVLPEKNIVTDSDGKVSFWYQDNKGKRQIHTLPGGEFLWLLLRHVLPRRFRRVRDFVPPYKCQTLDSATTAGVADGGAPTQPPPGAPTRSL